MQNQNIPQDLQELTNSTCFIVAYLYLINANIELPPMVKRIQSKAGI